MLRTTVISQIYHATTKTTHIILLIFLFSHDHTALQVLSNTVSSAVSQQRTEGFELAALAPSCISSLALGSTNELSASALHHYQVEDQSSALMSGDFGRQHGCFQGDAVSAIFFGFHCAYVQRHRSNIQLISLLSRTDDDHLA